MLFAIFATQHKAICIFCKYLLPSKGLFTKEKSLKMSKKDSFTVQSSFIQQLKDALPSNISLAEELSDLLEVSVDSAYRRIRGETALSIDEVVKICTHYKVPFNPLSHSPESSITFGIRPLDNDEASFEKYLNDILTDLKKIISFEEREMIYAAEEVPVFHHYGYKELTEFKFYFWNKSILNSKFTENKKFEFGIIKDSWIDLAKQIFNSYSKLPSTEIWTENTINSTLKQIAFYWDSGLFKNNTEALVVAEQLELMLISIEKQAEHSLKFVTGKTETLSEHKFLLYQSDVTIANNCMLVKTKSAMATYISYHTMNFMTTSSTNFCNDTDMWLKNLIKKATLLSGVSEKQRYQFFKAKYESINNLKDKISKG